MLEKYLERKSERPGKIFPIQMEREKLDIFHLPRKEESWKVFPKILERIMPWKYQPFLGFFRSEKISFNIPESLNFQLEMFVFLHTQQILGMLSADFQKNRQKIPILSTRPAAYKITSEKSFA